MLFILIAILEIAALIALGFFLYAVFYHLTQYQLPNSSPKKALTIILFFSLALVGLSAFLFFSIPWNLL